MKNKSFLSRRELVAALAIPSMAQSAAAHTDTMPADSHLVSLGREFDKITAQIDEAIKNGADIDDEVLNELGRLDAEIVNTRAKTIEGFRVKARAACWALLGDLDPTNQPTTDKRMALSIVRDLIQRYDPSLEHSGAVKTLIANLG
jgi:hypothetical protein